MTHRGNLTCVWIGRETDMSLPYTCVFSSRSCIAEIRRIFLPLCLPPFVLVYLDSRLEMFVHDGFNSSVAEYAAIFFGLGAKFFFWPIRCDFLLFRLVGGWLWCGTTFGDVCHPKKITLPLVFALASVYVRCSVTMPKKFFKNPQKIIKKQIARSLWGCAPPTN